MRKLDEDNVERVRYLRDGQAEGLVAWHLQNLPSGWHVFHNLACAASGDIDPVVVGPGGLFVISTKSRKRYVTRTPGGAILMNGDRLTDLKEAHRLAMWIRKYLETVLGKDAPWVQAVLALPLAEVNVPRREGLVWVLGEDDLLPEINPEQPQQGKRLNRDCVEKVVTALEPLGPARSQLAVDREEYDAR